MFSFNYNNIYVWLSNHFLAHIDFGFCFYCNCREIWTTVLPPESKDIFTAILGISKANRLDEGIYTCKVSVT